MKISYCSFLKSDEVPSARPGPNMIFLNMVKLDVFPAQAMIRNIQSSHHRNCHHHLNNHRHHHCNHHHDPNNHRHHPQAVVKVDDSGPGIIAGLNAGCWTVGIAKTVR